MPRASLPRLACPLLASATLAAAAWLPPATAQVRQCRMPEGHLVYTDRSCSALGAVEARRPQRRPASTRVYYGSCASTLPDLVYELTSAIDSGDVNRLAAHYHWPGLGGDAANATMDRLDAMAARPLLDLRIATRDVIGAPDPDDPFALPDVRMVPTGLRVEQLTGEGGAPVTTTLSLQRHLGCWWVRL